MRTVEFDPSRRKVLKGLGGILASVVFFPNFPPVARPEATSAHTIRQTIDNLWGGELTWVEIPGICAGQVLNSRRNAEKNKWEEQKPDDPSLVWIHPGYTGLLFIHRDELDRIQAAGENNKIKEGTKILFYSNWNHDEPVLKASFGKQALYRSVDFDDSNDWRVKAITESTKTVALVTCAPGDKRKVFYAWASLPK